LDFVLAWGSSLRTAIEMQVLLLDRWWVCIGLIRQIIDKIAWCLQKASPALAGEILK
jgi:hypothetical protein